MNDKSGQQDMKPLLYAIPGHASEQKDFRNFWEEGRIIGFWEGEGIFVNDKRGQQDMKICSISNV